MVVSTFATTMGQPLPIHQVVEEIIVDTKEVNN
jgi:hypothetical protein